MGGKLVLKTIKSHTLTHTYTYLNTQTHTHPNTRTNTQTHKADTRTRTHMQKRTHTHTHTHTQKQINTHKNYSHTSHTLTHTRTHTQIHINTYNICVYVCVHTYTHTHTQQFISGRDERSCHNLRTPLILNNNQSNYNGCKTSGLVKSTKWNESKYAQIAFFHMLNIVCGGLTIRVCV